MAKRRRRGVQRGNEWAERVLQILCDEYWPSLREDVSASLKLHSGLIDQPDQATWNSAQASSRKVIEPGLHESKEAALAALVFSCLRAARFGNTVGLFARYRVQQFIVPARFTRPELVAGQLAALVRDDCPFWFSTTDALLGLDAAYLAASLLWDRCKQRGWLPHLEQETPPSLIRAWKCGGGSPWVAAHRYAAAWRRFMWLPFGLGVRGIAEWAFQPEEVATESEHPLLGLLVDRMPAMFLRLPNDDAPEAATIALNAPEFDELEAACIHLEARMGGTSGLHSPEPPGSSISKLPELKPHDHQAWQLSRFSGMKQSAIATKLNQQHGTNYGQSHVSRMIARVKAHADASHLTELLPNAMGRPRAIDPKRLDIGSRTDKRNPRPSDLDG